MLFNIVNIYVICACRLRNLFKIMYFLVKLHIGYFSGWASGATDLTAIDPAIVSSGQLTDSRSDSPPQWLKAIEQNPSEAGLGIGSWSNILPYNIITGTLQGSIGNMHNPLAPQASQQTSRRSTMWPTTSPPPGFNSLSPLHTKQREAHKIESKYLVFL